MDIGTFWDIIETARAHSGPGQPFDQALAGHLASRTRRDILGYQERFDQMRAALYRRDIWAASYLVGGGCSDDAFIDFRAGVIAQGRDWYQTVAASPDSLAGHPAVADAPGCSQGEPLFYEAVSYAAPRGIRAPHRRPRGLLRRPLPLPGFARAQRPGTRGRGLRLR